jgi:Ca-activated chloride channel family protein
MTRAGGLLALFAMTATAPISAQQPTFRTDIDLISFGVTVTDRRGNYITDLTADEFDIIEEGQKQTLKVFARGNETESAPEMHVGLLFDTSGSMGLDIQLSRSAAIKFLNTLSDAVDMTLVDFDTEVRVARYGQQDFPRLVERIRSRKPDGYTALYDALGVYLDGAAEDDGRTILVLYTDGGDTRSTIGFSELMTLVRASDVTVYAIGFLNNQSSAVRNEQRARLHQIADATGGQAFFPTTMKDVEGMYEKIVAQIRAQYSLGYASTNTKQDGEWRKVEIKVKRPDVRIQTRKGYFAPYRQ